MLGLRASAQQISLIVDHRVVNDTLFLDFEVANSGIPSLNFSTADFIIALDTNGLFFSQSVIVQQGNWSAAASACFNNVAMTTSGDSLTLHITNNPGAGCTSASQATADGDTATLASVAIPIENCVESVSLRKVIGAGEQRISWEGLNHATDLGNNYDQVFPGIGLVDLNNIGAPGFVISNARFCSNDPIVTAITGANTSAGFVYEFFKYDASTASNVLLATQSGTNVIYTTVPGDNIEDGDSLFARVSDASCTYQTTAFPLTEARGILNNLADTIDACENDTVTITYSSNVTNTYTWYDSVGGSLGGNVNEIDVIPTEDMLVIVQADSAGCSQIDTVTIDLPEPLDLGADITICAADFGVQNISVPNIYATYQWYYSRPGTVTYSSIPGATSNVLIIDSIGSFKLDVETVNTCELSDTIEIESNVGVQILSDQIDTLCFGQSATLSVINTGSGPAFVSYEWITGETTPTISATSSGNYTVIVTDANGCIGMDTFTNVIHNKPVARINTDTSFINADGIKYNEWWVGELDLSAAFPALSSMWNVTYHDGSIYLTEDGNLNHIRRIDLADTTASVYAGASSTNNTFFDSTAAVHKTIAEFGFPNSTAFDSRGQLYVTNHDFNAISKIDVADFVSVFSGNPGNPAIENREGQFKEARYYDPTGIFIDQFDNIYVSDHENHVIKIISKEGFSDYLAGSSSSPGQSGSVDGIGLDARFNLPMGLDMDLEGNLYVADQGGHLIRKIDLAANVTTFLGVPLMGPGYVDGPASTSQFNNPWNVVADDMGNLFISDRSNNVLRQYDALTDSVITIAGTGVIGDLNGAGDEARFSLVRGLTMNPETRILYMVDALSFKVKTIHQNKTVRVCPNLDVPLSGALSQADSYRWYDAVGTLLSDSATYVATDSGMYVLEVTKGGCVNTDSIFVTYLPTNAVSAVPDSAICPGDEAVLFARDAADYVSFDWYDLDSAINIGTTASITVSDSGNYVVFATDAQGCIVTDTASITIKDLPDLSNVNMIPETLFCIDDTIEVVTPASVTGHPLYLQTIWQDSSIGDTQNVTAGGLYVASIITTEGCMITEIDTAYFYSRPDLDITAPLSNHEWYVSTLTSGLGQPTDIVEAPNGDLFVSDQLNHVIYRVDKAGNSSVYAGQSGNSGYVDDNVPTNALFDRPMGLALDNDGNLYIADAGNNLIRRISTAGVVSTYAGQFYVTLPNHMDGHVDSCRFNTPSDITFAANGYLYVADKGNDVIRWIEPYSQQVHTIGVVDAGSTIDGPVVTATFDEPGFLYFHKSGLLMVGQNSVLRSIDLVAGIVNSFDNGPTGGVSFTGPVNGITALNDELEFVFAANNRQQLMLSSGSATTVNFAGQNITPGTTDGRSDTARFNTPMGMTISSNHHIYLADQVNGSIRVLKDSSYVVICENSSSELQSTSGSSYLWSGPNAFSSNLQSVTVADSGRYYLEYTDANGCFAYDSINVNVNPLPIVTIDTAINNTGIGPDSISYCRGDTLTLLGNPHTTGFLYQWKRLGDPSIIEIDDSLLVSNEETTFVLFLREVATTCANFDTITVQYYIDDLDLGTDQTICYDDCITIDADPSANPEYSTFLWSDSSTNSSLQVCEGGVYSVEVLTVNNCVYTDSIDVSVNLEPLISINSGSRKYVESIAGSSAGFSNNVDPVLAQFNRPKDLTMDDAGNLFVADHQNNAIRRIAAGTGVVTTFATLTGNPNALAIDKNNRLFVAQEAPSKIVVVSTTGTVSDYAGDGTAAYNDGPAISARFNNPAGIAVDENNRVYVADADNHVVRMIDPKTMLVSTIGVYSGGVFSGTYVDGDFNTATFNHPGALAIDPNGDLYIAANASGSSPRVRKIDLHTNQVSTYSLQNNNVSFGHLNALTTDNHASVWATSDLNTLLSINSGDQLSNHVAGSSGNTGDQDGFGSQALFNLPSGVHFDTRNGGLYVADANNHKIKFIEDSSEVFYCVGDSAQLDVSLVQGNGGTFTWSNGANTTSVYANSPGNYSVTFVDGTTGCSTSDSIYVTELPNPQFASLIPDTTICSYDSINLYAVGMSVLDSVVWSYIDTVLNDTVVLSSGMIADTLFDISGANVGTYLATVINPSCDTTIAVEVKDVNIQATIAVSADTICFGDQVQLDGTGSFSSEV